MTIFLETSEAAFDVLDSAEVLHEFDDSVTLRVSREMWAEYIRQGSE